MTEQVAIRKGQGKSRLNREKAIQALLAHSTVRAAAQELQLNERTLYRWLRQPAFLAAYNIAKKELMQSATNRLQKAALNAVEVLVGIANTATATESARVTAAAKVIELAIKTSTLEDIESRISELENNNVAEGSAQSGWQGA